MSNPAMVTNAHDSTPQAEGQPALESALPEKATGAGRDPASGGCTAGGPPVAVAAVSDGPEAATGVRGPALGDEVLPPVTPAVDPRSLWLVAHRDFGFLGEVAAPDLAGALALAAQGWPGLDGAPDVYHKRRYEKFRAKLERDIEKDLGKYTYHEAGHVVVAHRLGYQIDRVEIGPVMNEVGGRFDPHGDSLGRIGYWDRPRQGEVDFSGSQRRRLLLCLAGPVCDSRFRGLRPWRRYDGRRVTGSDRAAVERYAPDLALRECGCRAAASGPAASGLPDHDRCVKQYLDQLVCEVQAALDADWHVVEAVAVELARRRSLNGTDVDRIVAGCAAAGQGRAG
jgi:hypothetical protein